MYNKIIDNLYLGDASSAYENDFALIVNCCPEVHINYANDNVVWLKFHDDRDDNEKLVSLLYTSQILEKIHNHLLSGETVLVHCAMGIQRSATVVACYLLKYTCASNQNVSETIRYIQSKREEAFSTGYPFLPTMAFYSLIDKPY